MFTKARVIKSLDIKCPPAYLLAFLDRSYQTGSCMKSGAVRRSGGGKQAAADPTSLMDSYQKKLAYICICEERGMQEWGGG